MKQDISSIRLLPCGHSCGLNLLQKDFKVVDFIPVMKANGLYYYPARDAGIRVNDVILELEGNQIKTEYDICKMVNEFAKTKDTIEISLRRNDMIMHKVVKPFYYSKANSYKIGIRLKAITIGVGTLTFYDPASKMFGALGHSITNLPLEPFLKNTIVPATISSITKGRPQRPGKKVGYLNKKNEFIGIISRNSITGIYGTLEGIISNPYFSEPISVMPKDKIREDKGCMYTVVEGNTIEKFKIRIDEVKLNDNSNKDIAIMIKDSNLEKRTGGIVLGMSGSPIIQDDQIIGAISYASYNDSLRGYAVSMENMLKQSQLLTSSLFL